MSSFARHKKKTNNDDILQITNLEDDFEEFNVTHDIKPQAKILNTEKQKRIGGEQNRLHSYPTVSEYVKSKQTGKAESEIPVNVNKTEKSKEEKSAVTNHVVRTQNDSKSETNSRGSSHASSSSGSSRDSFTTPSNQKLPVSSVQINKRYTATPRNKNLKGFGREEKDLFIDDLEDF